MGKTDYFTNRRIWITGASSGIGKALARELSRRGAKVALSARSEDKLRAIAEEMGGEPRALVVPCDASKRDEVKRAASAIVDKWGGLDTAILNAGICEYINAKNFESDVFERTFAVNYFGVVYGIETALPILRQSDRPHLVGMSSTVAYAGLPRAEAYGSSKAAIYYLMVALRAHLYRENIPVSIICPGFVKTPLTDQNDFEMPMRISAEKAGRIIADGLARQKSEIHFPKPFSIPLKLLALLPDALWTRLCQRFVRDE